MRPNGACDAQRASISFGVTPCFAASADERSSKRAVAVKPGQTLLTRMLDGPYSLASDFTRPLTPARMELERIKPSIGCFTETEVKTMNLPHFRACISGSVSFARCTVLIKFRSADLRQSSMLVSAKLLDGGPPEFATQISTRPNRSCAAATKA